MRPTGMAADASTRLLLWSSTDRTVALFDGTAWHALALPDSSSPLAGTLDSSGTAILFDPIGPRFLTYDSVGMLTTSRPHGLHALVVAAAPYAGGWYLLTEESLLLRMPSATPDTLWRAFAPSIRWHHPQDPDPHHLVLIADRNYLIVTSRQPPFSVVRVDSTLSSVTRFDNIATADLPLDVKTGDGIWHSLATLPVGDDHYVQTLFDGQSDRRLLIVYDKCGTIVTTGSVNAPLGIAGATGHELLAIRYAGGIQVVWYDWQLTNLKDDSC